MFSTDPGARDNPFDGVVHGYGWPQQFLLYLTFSAAAAKRHVV